ncbi:MAG: cache domain-containing protein, partial [Angelakisella sp.]
MKIAVGLTIFLGVLIILFTNEKSFKNIAADDIENISKLSSSIIYAEIDNSLTQPIFVGLTMANDRFLKGWLREEAADGASAEQNELMRQYLMDYSNKYNYDSVFLTSEKSGIYYSQDGINKVVSTENAHDVWYYDFMASKKAYDLDVDFDEVNDNQLTVFTNCLITDENNSPMGAVGVGIKMSYLQAMLQSYEEKYDLKACLINEDGLVQVDSLAENIETVN